jgi:hypothetical protein
MLGDYFTNPVQGSKFKKFRASILNLKPIPPTVSQECVETSPLKAVGISKLKALEQDKNPTITSSGYDSAKGDDVSQVDEIKYCLSNKCSHHKRTWAQVAGETNNRKP